MNNKAFVFTGMAFLLILPAIFLAASYFEMARYGNLGITISLHSDKVFIITTDLRETIAKAAQDSGRWNAYLAVKNITETFENLTSEKSLDYATQHSWYTDPEITTLNSSTAIENNIRASINYAITGLINNYSTSGVTLSVNNGNNITDEVISLYQKDPWGFYVNVTSLPLFVQFGVATFNTTIPAISAYVSIENLQDPYIFVKTKGRSTNKIVRTPYTPFNETYDQTVANNTIYQLYTALIGSRSNGDPRPYYHNSSDGLSFFCRLDGKNATQCTDDGAEMETFVVGDPLSKSGVSIVDHYYFTDVAGSGITISGSPMDVPTASPNSYSFLIDDTHLSYYGLSRTY